MANFNDIVNTTVFVSGNPIPEPLSPPEILTHHLRRFDPEIYNTSPDSHLYKLISALIGDAGAGLLAKQTSYARFQSRLESTHFSDLDKFFGSVLGLPRLSEERYSINPIDGSPLDPRSQALYPSKGEDLNLVGDTWDDVFIKDSAYRSRCLTWTQALMYGGTARGLALAAEAALGAECFVYENYRYLDAGYNEYLNEPNMGSSSINRKQFFIIPQLPQSAVTPDRQYYLYRLLDRLKPVGTFFTVYYAGDPRIAINSLNVESTSNYFFINRRVTGNGNVTWPTLNASKGLWIEPNVNHPAPTFAFLQRQEYATWFAISGISASDYHSGMFSQQQQSFFPHLRVDSNPPREYLPQYAYSPVDTPYSSTNPWVNGYGSPDTPIVINNYYPLEYFNLNSAPLVSNTPTRFWSTNEKDQGESDSLTYDLGYIRQMNFVDLEICQKPIDLLFEYSSDGITWSEASFSTEFTSTDQIQFLPSDSNPWFHYEGHFDTFLARYFKITFTRRDVLAYPPTRDSFPWSIEIKNSRLGHQVNNTADVLTDDSGNYLSIDGIDILNNKYTSEVIEYVSSNVTDNNSSTFWQSQPNPSPFAVENLYFDLRLSDSSTDVGQVITELYIDPITTGPYLHLYWSNDDSTSDWDSKMWSPIHKHFALKRGYYYLPSPIKAKYFKIEFSNLTPIPYQVLESPQTPAIKYKKYPQWVQDMFLDNYPVKLNKDNLQYPYSSVTLNMDNVGFSSPNTILTESLKSAPAYSSAILDNFIQDQKSILTSSVRSLIQTKTRNDIGSTINIINSTTYKNGLDTLLDLSNPISRYIHNTSMANNSISVDFTNEQAFPKFDPPINQSSISLDAEEVNKKIPVMWFPFTTRHGYQELEVPRSSKIAYIVGIKSINFYRRDYSVLYDESFYQETLDDSVNITSSDFLPGSSDWNFSVPA